MTNILQTNITPRSLTLAQEADFWYMIHKALWTICDKLDDDTGVPLTTYEANCYTALINTVIEDSTGNIIGLKSSDLNFHRISPRGITDNARLHMMYNFFNAWETLCEQLDTDTLTDSTYEALCYTALFLQTVRGPTGTILGNGTRYQWGPSCHNQQQLVELMYMVFNAIETLTEQLDGDGTVNSTDYEADAFTAVCTLKITNGANATVGN
jgi:hypothetical protein